MQYLKNFAFNDEKVAVPLLFFFLVGSQNKMVTLGSKGIHIKIPIGYLTKRSLIKRTYSLQGLISFGSPCFIHHVDRLTWATPVPPIRIWRHQGLPYSHHTSATGHWCQTGLLVCSHGQKEQRAHPHDSGQDC